MRIVLACFGDRASLQAVRHWSSRAEVVAVAIDLTGAVPLSEVRDLALASGAVRCHALDGREAFAREVLLPALRARRFRDPHEAFVTTAREFVERTLCEIALMEHGTVMPPSAIPLATSVKPAAVVPARFVISFAEGFPKSVNGVDMTLTELMDSIETITGQWAPAVLDDEYARAAQLPAESR